MLKRTILAGLAVTMTCLNAVAETDSDFTAGAWNIIEPHVPAYQPGNIDMPPTGAARFEANPASSHDDILEVDFGQPSRFIGGFEQSSPGVAPGGEQMFGPGPELVAPTPAPVFELRRR